MVMVSRDKIKVKGIKRLKNSFKYAIEGLIYAFKYEQNITIHFIATILVILFSIILKISLLEWIIIILMIGLVIATELINTSIEAIVDLSTNEINPLAKIAKDTAAAAVLVFAITSIIIAGIIFIPKILSII